MRRAALICCLMLAGGLPARAQPQAAADYLAGLEGATAASAEVQRVVPLLPDSIASSLSRPGLGARLVRWWRAEDPLPSTAENERLEEHLARVREALSSYSAKTAEGYDDRGRVFVRFGSPTRRRRVDPESDVFIARAIREEPAVRRTDFPRNEVWHYPELGAYYVFTETPEGYRDGTLVDLIPRALRAGGYNAATQSRAELLGRVVRWIHKDLYAFDPHIQRRLSDIDATIGADGEALWDSNTRKQTGLIVSNVIQRSISEDERVRRDRDRRLPASRSAADPVGRIEAQAARFLNGPVGTASGAVWVGWSQPLASVARRADSLGASGGARSLFLIEETRSLFDRAYERIADERAAFLVLPGGSYSEPQWSVFDPVDVSERAAIQWDVTPSDRDGNPLLTAPISQAVFRVPPFAELVEPGATVAVSDLLPLAVESIDGALGADRLDGLPPPHPYGAVPSDRPMALYYEVYGPADAPAGVTVRLDVEVTQRRNGTLLRGSQREQSTSGLEFVLSGGREPQIVVVDPESLDGADEVTVEVTLTRVGTGERARRSATFRVSQPA